MDALAWKLQNSLSWGLLESRLQPSVLQISPAVISSPLISQAPSREQPRSPLHAHLSGQMGCLSHGAGRTR